MRLQPNKTMKNILLDKTSLMLAKSVLKPHIEGFPEPDSIIVHHFRDDHTIVHAEWWFAGEKVLLEVYTDRKACRWFYDDSEFGTEQLIERSEALAKVER